MSITPDTKDWTWVLDARCPECGLETRDLAPAAVPGMISEVAATFGDVLAEGATAGRRPRPSVWSPLEYACHVRDVCRVFSGRLALMLAEVDPQFENWDQDATAVQDAYGEQDPTRVAGELRAAADRLATGIEAVPDDAWDRTARRSDGAVFTVATLTRYLAHDLVHHVYDVTGRRDARRLSPVDDPGSP